MHFSTPALNDKEAFLCRAVWLLAALLLGGSRSNLLLAQTAANELVVISQVYGAGGNGGATYKNDFVELFNRGSSPVNLAGWTVQYAAAAGSFTAGNTVGLSGTLAPGQYYLVQLAGNTGAVGADLPPPDASGGFGMNATAGKVALANSGDVVVGATDANVVDFVGYGSTATDAEGSAPAAYPNPSSSISSTKSISRNSSGCTDTDNNGADFSTVTVSPHNSTTATSRCGAQLTATPATLANFVTTTGATSDAQSYVLTGTDLSSAAVIKAPTGYKVALAANGPYGNTVTTDAPDNDNLSVTVYVVLDGATTGAATGSINNVSGSATAAVAVSGSSNAPVTVTRTVRWDGGAGTTFWFDAANWSGDVVPGSDADVVLDHTFVAGSYQVRLQSRETTAPTVEPSVEILSLKVKPDGGEAITLEIPPLNTNGAALTITRAGPKDVALAIYENGIVVNGTGANSGSAGAGLVVAGSNPTMYLYNGGTYRHYTNRAHVAVLNNLAAVSGTENGRWEFRLATTSSSSLALSRRSYPTLVLRANPNATITSYTGSSSALTIRGDLLIEPTVTFAPNVTGDLRIAGDLDVQGTMRLTPKSKNVPATGQLVLNGASPQIISASTLNKEAAILLGANVTVQISNPDGIILKTPVTVPGTLQLTAGVLNTDVTNVLTLAAGATVSGGDPGSFVNGPLDYVASGPATLRFPLGRSSAAGSAYRPLTLAVTKLGAPATFRAVQTEGQATGSLGGGLTRINQARCFALTPTPALPADSFEGYVTLSFGSDDRVTNPEASTLVVAGNDGSGWLNLGRSNYTGTAAGGTLTSGLLASLGRFTLASTDPNNAQNPLPVELTAFTAQRGPAGALLRWTTTTELSCREFEVERSFDGQTFTRLGSLPGHGTTSQPQTYHYADATLGAAGAYYRLRQIDVDGRTTISPVYFVAAVPAAAYAYPNPVTDQLTLYAPAPATIRLRGEVGRVVYQSSAPAGTSQHAVAQLPAGVYVLEIQLPGQLVIRQKLVKVR